jgi:3',5'-cyclic AMP phosphodiesterase CpdA
VDLVHLTDLHFGCEDAAALAATARFIRERAPAAVIVTGDISRDGLKSELEAAFAWMRGLGAPVLVTPGNHDVPYYNPWGRLIEPFGRFRRAAGEDMRLGPWHTPDWSIVPITTARGLQPRLNWAQGAISTGQTRQAIAELAKAAPGAVRLIATHHPLDWPNDAPIQGRTWGGREAERALIAGGADIFLCGHLHFGYVREIGGGALSLSAGTLSLRVRHEPCGFNLIRIKGPGLVEIELVRLHQGGLDVAAKRAFALSPRLTQIPA